MVVCVVAAALLLLPAPAVANPNAGQLFISAFITFTIGVLGISVVEAVAVWLVLGTRKRYALPLMVIANFASSWGGVWLLTQLAASIAGASPLPINGMFLASVTATIASIPLAILMEAPFFWLCARLRRAERPKWRAAFWRSLSPNIVANVVTGSALVVWMLATSNFSMALKLEESADASILDFGPAHADAWVCYITSDGAVERVRLDGSDRSTLMAPGTFDAETELTVALAEDDSLGLFAVGDIEFDGRTFKPAHVTPIASGFAGGSMFGRHADWSEVLVEQTVEPDREALIIERSDSSVTDEWPRGVPGLYPAGPLGFDAYYTGGARVYSTTRLSEHRFLSELRGLRDGAHIVIVDTDAGVLAHLARGRSPVVVIEEPASGAGD